MFKSAIILLSFISVSAVASPDNHAGPCKAVKSACEAAGFEKGKHKEGKGLWKDCIDPVIEGKTVEGVTIDTATIEQCKIKKETHKGKKGKGKHSKESEG